MRTTVDIPDSLYRQLKSMAALQGCSVRELIVRGVETQLNGDPHKKKGRIKLPIIESKRPGWLKLTNRTINEILFP
jgi:hypothetical protein